MHRLLKSALIAAAATLLIAAPAFAHTGHDSTFALKDGFLHPLLGLDHLLAMLAVGILAWQMGGRAVPALPAAFLAVMTAGAIVAARGIGVAGVEVLIAASVVVLGLAIALEVQLHIAAATALVALFAFMHGHAHGAEIPDASGLAGYVLGFVVATALLHGAGIALGWQLSRNAYAVRATGAAIAAVGLASWSAAGLFAG